MASRVLRISSIRCDHEVEESSARKFATASAAGAFSRATSAAVRSPESNSTRPTGTSSKSIRGSSNIFQLTSAATAGRRCRLDTTSTWLPRAPIARRPMPFSPSWTLARIPGGAGVEPRSSFDSVAMVSQCRSKVSRSMPTPSSLTTSTSRGRKKSAIAAVAYASYEFLNSSLSAVGRLAICCLPSISTARARARK